MDLIQRTIRTGEALDSSYWRRNVYWWGVGETREAEGRRGGLAAGGPQAGRRPSNRHCHLQLQLRFNSYTLVIVTANLVRTLLRGPSSFKCRL